MIISVKFFYNIVINRSHIGWIYVHLLLILNLNCLVAQLVISGVLSHPEEQTATIIIIIIIPVFSPSTGRSRTSRGHTAYSHWPPADSTTPSWCTGTRRTRSSRSTSTTKTTSSFDGITRQTCGTRSAPRGTRRRDWCSCGLMGNRR